MPQRFCRLNMTGDKFMVATLSPVSKTKVAAARVGIFLVHQYWKVLLLPTAISLVLIWTFLNKMRFLVI